jgi:hypothetical protein
MCQADAACWHEPTALDLTLMVLDVVSFRNLVKPHLRLETFDELAKEDSAHDLDELQKCGVVTGQGSHLRIFD